MDFVERLVHWSLGLKSMDIPRFYKDQALGPRLVPLGPRVGPKVYYSSKLLAS